MVLSAEDHDVKLFTVLDDAVFYLENDEDDLFVLLPSAAEKSGYRTEPLQVDFSSATGINAEDVTVVYMMRIGAVSTVLSVVTLVCAGLSSLL